LIKVDAEPELGPEGDLEPSEPGVAPRERWVRRALLFGPVVLMLLFGSLAIGRQSMFGTEEASLWAGRLPTAKLFHLLNHLDAVHGLYYFGLHVMFKIFGSNVVTLRLPSLIGAALSVLVVNALTRRLTGSPGTGAIAAVLTVLAPFFLFWGVSGRSYGIDPAFALTGTLIFVWALQSDGRRPPEWVRWILYTLVVAVGGYLHEMTVLALAAHAVTLAIVRPRWCTVLMWLAASVGALAAMIPIISISARERGQLGWIARPGWSKLHLILVDFFGPEPTTLAVMLALVLVGVVFAIRAPGGGRLDLRSVALPLFVVPPALLYAESYLSTPLFGGNHYILYCLPAGLMLAAAGLMRIARAVERHHVRLGWLTVAVVLVFVAVTEALPLNRLRGGAGYPQDLGPVARFVGAHSQPGDLAVYLPAGYEYTPLGYPDDFRNVTSAAVLISPNKADVFRGIRMSMAQERVNLLDHQRVWAIGLLDEPSYKGRHEMELRTLTKHFRLVTERSYHEAQVALYVRVHTKHRD
jgi:mannosyltransferase